MSPSHPSIVVIGGPNGAGKTTISRAVLAETLGITEFVNADTIAAGLSGFNPGHAAIAAGRIMLIRLRELAEMRADFAFESLQPFFRALAGDTSCLELPHPHCICLPELTRPGRSPSAIPGPTGRPFNPARNHPPPVRTRRAQLHHSLQSNCRCVARLR
jgi:hypothetical protein